MKARQRGGWGAPALVVAPFPATTSARPRVRRRTRWRVASPKRTPRPGSQATALGAAAAGSALQVAVVPRLTWEYLGDTLRTFATLETFAVLLAASIVVRRVRSRASSAGTVASEGASAPG